MLGSFIKDNGTSTRGKHKVITTWLGAVQIGLFVLDRRFIVIFTPYFTRDEKVQSDARHIRH